MVGFRFMAILSKRRRKIILLCAALGVGGYASYKVYKSSFVSRKRKRVASLLSSLSRLIEAFSLGVDSTSVLASDLRSFLLSDVDEVPRSLKQSLKIARCREFQEALTVFSSCISRGVVSSVSESSSKVGDDPSGLTSRRRKNSLDKGVNIYFDNKEQVVCAIRSSDNLASASSTAVPSKLEDLPERLMQKLFSESGTGFASAVLGSVARNTVLSALEGYQKLNHVKQTNSEWDLRGLAPDSSTDGFERSNAFLDIACSSKGRALIADCTRAFVSTAVGVYLDKTKDVNFYEQMVEGMIKPNHRPAVDELLTTICNGAVETFVRASHDALSSGSEPVSEEVSKESLEEPMKNLEELVSSDLAGVSSSQGNGSSGSQASSSQDMILLSSSGRSRINLLPNWVEGISRTLAVPSNRKLLIDVAGTVTSEAIRSFFEVFVGVISRGNLKLRFVPSSSSRSSSKFDGRQQVEEISLVKKSSRLMVFPREAVVKSLVVLTVFLAILMHVFVDVPVHTS